MIIKCKVCNGTGRFKEGPIDLWDETKVLCPVCKGAGELELSTPQDRLTQCKYCEGKGITEEYIALIITTKICVACKGIGFIERPVVGTIIKGVNEIKIPQTPRLPRYEFDVAVSFAGEDRKTVEQYCETLTPRGLKIFYDKYDQINLWGANLYDKLDEIYRTKAMCCVIFISKHYADKVWTNHERKSAQARALLENIEYILPVRLDDTEIPGIPPTIGYLDLREISIANLVYMTIEKVNKLKSKKT